MNKLASTEETTEAFLDFENWMQTNKVWIAGHKFNNADKLIFMEYILNQKGLTLRGES